MYYKHILLFVLVEEAGHHAQKVHKTEYFTLDTTQPNDLIAVCLYRARNISFLSLLQKATVISAIARKTNYLLSCL